MGITIFPLFFCLEQVANYICCPSNLHLFPDPFCMLPNLTYSLLFKPDELDFDSADGPFDLFVIEKSPNKFSTDNYLLDEMAIIRYLKIGDKEARNTVRSLTELGKRNRIKDLTKTFTQKGNSKASAIVIRKNYFRWARECLQTMATNSQSPKIYFYNYNEKGNLGYHVAKLHVKPTTLYFSCVWNAAKEIEIETHVSFFGQDFLVQEFNQYHFLLEKNNEFIFITIEEMNLLHWLQNINYNTYIQKPDLFLEHIVKKLETTHVVNRNNCFASNEIEVIPEPCVLVSELSNMYLMLTPQFIYDGFLVEGNYTPSSQIEQNGKVYQIVRNEALEKKFITELQLLHPTFAKQNKGYYYVTFADASKKSWFLKTYHTLIENNVNVVGIDMLQTFRFSQHKPSMDIVLKEVLAQSVIFTTRILFDTEEVNAKEVQKVLLARQRVVMLSDNTIGYFTDEWLAQYEQLIKHSRIEKNVLEVPKWVALSVIPNLEKDSANAKAMSFTKQDWMEAYTKWQSADEEIFAVPAIVKASLRIYQHKGFEWMILLSQIGAGAYLADDMGLGKTLQTICFLAHLLEHKQAKKCLIICPSSLLYNWKLELQKFLPSVDMQVLNEGNITQASLQHPAPIAIASYGITRSKIDALQTIPWDAIVLDESHNIKNPSAQITKAVMQLAAPYKVSLSGTPIMNNTFDLYSQMQFLLPNLLGGPEFFKTQYANPIDRNKNMEAMQQLQKLTEPYILRRTKLKVAKDLPDKVEQVIWCDMNEKHADFYNTLKARIYGEIMEDVDKNGLAKSKIKILAGITYLRQACGSPHTIKGYEEEQIPSTKIDYLLEELEGELAGQKVLIFSQFKGMLHSIAAKLQEKNIAYFHFDGDTKVEERQHLVNQYQQEDSTTNIFLISLKAGNAGLNITAAQYVFLADPWWNSAVEAQAVDRTHRIGQTKTVFAYKLVCKNTIEEKIMQLKLNKNVVSENVIQAEENFVKTLQLDDLKELFG
jgi:SNF2 family DNA or RNA helicase